MLVAEHAEVTPFIAAKCQWALPGDHRVLVVVGADGPCLSLRPPSHGGCTFDRKACLAVSSSAINCANGKPRLLMPMEVTFPSAFTKIKRLRQSIRKRVYCSRRTKLSAALKIGSCSQESEFIFER